MTEIIVIEKNGTIKQSLCKDLDNLYKSCNFRKADGFELRHSWNNLVVGKKTYNISVYARDEGKANTENKYDMPPPIDSDLYFGNLAIINKNKKGDLDSLSVNEWNKIYESLFGGFENLDDFNDDDEEDELEDLPASLKTKVGGYLKDGFVVDNSDDEEVIIGTGDDDEDEDEDEDEDGVSYLIDSSEEDTNDVVDEDEDEESIEDCGSELDYEEYEYSDEE
mgnify:CR=1 FL=1|jgi:hypothetical protein